MAVTFLDLPAELRNVIYEANLVQPKVICLTVRRKRLRFILDSVRGESYPVALIRTCKQIAVEAAPIFYGQNHFVFTDSWAPGRVPRGSYTRGSEGEAARFAYKKLCRKIGPRNVASIRRVTFYNHSLGGQLLREQAAPRLEDNLYRHIQGLAGFPAGKKYEYWFTIAVTRLPCPLASPHHVRIDLHDPVASLEKNAEEWDKAIAPWSIRPQALQAGMMLRSWRVGAQEAMEQRELWKHVRVLRAAESRMQEPRRRWSRE
jgi:hypothetical protein